MVHGETAQRPGSYLRSLAARALPRRLRLALALYLALQAVLGLGTSARLYSNPPVVAAPAPDASAAADPEPPAEGPADRRVLLNFRDTSIEAILASLSELLDVTFVKDQEIQGNVSIINARRMTRDEALKTLEAVLSIRGITLVKLDAGTYQVVPSARASTLGSAVRVDRAVDRAPGHLTEEFVTRIVKLTYASPDKVLPVISQLLIKDVEKVGTHPESGSIVITAAAGNADRLVAILNALDVPAARGRMDLIALKYLGPEQAQDLVERAFPPATTPPAPGAPASAAAAPGTRAFRLVPVPGHNQLVLIAQDELFDDIVRFIRKVDGARLSETPLRIYHLRVASAAKLAAFLSATLAGHAPGGDQPADARGGGAVVLPDTVTNSLMVVASPETHRMVARLVAQLDYEGFVNARNRVFTMKHAKAVALAAQLGPIVNRTGENDKDGPAVVLMPDPRLNVLVVSSASASKLAMVESLVEALDQPSASDELVTHVYYLSHAPAKQVERVLRELYAKPAQQDAQPVPAEAPAPGAPETEPPAATDAATNGAVVVGRAPAPAPAQGGRRERLEDRGAALPKGSIKVVADELTNSVVILASEANYQQIVQTLEKLDVDPLQVLVEVVIAEVQMRRDHQFGVDLAFLTGNGNNIRTDFRNLNPDNTPNTSLTGLRSFVISDQSFKAMLHGFNENAAVNVMATPKLFANNNQQASLLIGSQVPVITGRAISTGGNIVSTVEYKDVGTKLVITPQINRQQAVTLKIEQEVKTLNGTGVEQNPILDTREARTTATVANGEAVLLGGFLQDDDTRVHQFVPGLGQIPIIRYFFGDRKRVSAKRELIFVFKPTVVSGSADASRMSSVKIDESIFRGKTSHNLPRSQVRWRKSSADQVRDLPAPGDPDERPAEEPHRRPLTGVFRTPRAGSSDVPAGP